ncbi:MAG TPA: beta-propeller domain-containing protein [Verrucomicrobiae bacterium]|nr:beta-propeller domain-containing protein [Verrucomicrobiae bacterium]
MIQSVQVGKTNIHVTASVPPGNAAIVLEHRTQFGTGAWVPVAVKRGAAAGSSLTFDLPRDKDFGFLRVRADASLPLPTRFYTGTNEFDAQSDSSLAAFDNFGPAAPNGGGTREVVESDIWRLHGDTLYFFNQNRGLQVIDVSDPDNLQLLGTLNLPAAGDQLYLLKTNHVVLLTRDTCGTYGGFGPAYGIGASSVLVVAVSNGAPAIAAQIPVDGFISESRMVGDALYVASQSMRATASGSNTVWEWGTRLVSFDLSTPALPIARSTNWFPGYNNVVYATDTYFFAVTLGTGNGSRSTVNIIDITAEDGTMHDYASLQLGGVVADKFKLNWSDGVLAAISEVSSNPRLTRLETFSLPPPGGVPVAPAKLGDVEVGHGERLFATRFDGTRAYIVTFFQIDPLWIVDLSDPANPVVTGELEVPGWSTHIHPLGDRLVAVGVETNRTTVSLFDVSNPSNPALASRVQLGTTYSYSEAQSDEKAFNVLAEEGLILLPVQGSFPDPRAWVQLIDLNTNSLVMRGTISQDFVPRRATVHRDRIVSISATELLSADATNRDAPQVTGRLALSWPVNQVFLAGDYLLQVMFGTRWDFDGDAGIIVAPRSDSSQIVSHLAFTNAPIVGATVRSNSLYVLQATTGYALAGTNILTTSDVWLTVVGLDALPALNVLGEVSASISRPVPMWGGNFHPVWLGTNLLVWAGGGSTFLGGPWDPVAFGPSAGLGFWPYPNQSRNGGGQLLAFDVANELAPEFVSEVDLATNNWWGFSKPYVAGELVYLSHNASVPYGSWTNAGDWSPFYKTFLDVIDYTDPAHPTPRKPVNVPGTLKGISHEGSLLYTIGFYGISASGGEGSQALVASAYDGIAAHAIDALPLTNRYNSAAVVDGANVFLTGREWLTVSNSVKSELETWVLNGEGEFTLLGSAKLSGEAMDLALFPGLVAAQVGWAQVDVFDRSNPAALRLVGHGPQASCLPFNLQLGDARPGDELWLPLDFYGVTSVLLAP